MVSKKKEQSVEISYTASIHIANLLQADSQTKT